MKWLNGTKIRLVLVGIVAAIVLGGRTANADFTFGTPTNLGPTINSSADDCVPSISSDGLELYFDSSRPGGYGNWDIWVTRRPTRNADWGNPVNLGQTVNSSVEDIGPIISDDGLEIYFTSKRPGGYGDWDIWVTRRPTKDADWGTPINLGPTVNSSSDDGGSSISADGLKLYISSMRPGGYGSDDIFVTERVTINDPWESPVNLGTVVNSSAQETSACISANGLLLLFSEDFTGPFRTGGYGNADIWLTTRASVSDPWDTPVNLGPVVNTSAGDICSGRSLSPDGSTLYFWSNRPGGQGNWDLWQASIEPVVDLNCDGIVDSADMCIMIDHWGENYSLCDIGPTPLGDGIVDVEDLIVLSEHLFEDVNDPTLIAHWPLDEAQGVIAYDSVSICDGTLMGGPVWQPDGGIVNGALQFDGIDDYVSTGFVLNPADGAFSVFAWIKGGVPGQVVVSQQGAANWLAADTEGNLMTELKGIGRSTGPLFSETVITDGQWHRIGLVWDGSNRTLYVNGIVVAEDIQSGLQSSQMGLYIGTGKAMETGTYFSGLIDDIRIYNRAVSP